MPYLIKKTEPTKQDANPEQSTDLYKKDDGNFNFGAEDSDLMLMLDDVVYDINFCINGEWCVEWLIDVDDWGCGWGSEADGDIIEIVDRVLWCKVANLKIYECEDLIKEFGMYEALSQAREMEIEYGDLHLEKSWRMVVYAILKSGIALSDDVEEVDDATYEDVKKRQEEADALQ